MKTKIPLTRARPLANRIRDAWRTTLRGADGALLDKDRDLHL